MRLGFDASVIFSSVGGTRVYASQLLSALVSSKPNWSYFLYARSRDQSDELSRLWSDSNVRAIAVPGSPNVWRLQARLPAQLRRDAIDLYHSLGFFLPLGWKGAKVVTIHDLNMFVNWRSWVVPNKFVNWADLALQTPLAIRAADRIITDSQFSKSSIERLMHTAPEKTVVIPLAPDPFFDEPPTADEIEEARALTASAPFVLFVGLLTPQKNLRLLIHAFAASDLAGSPTRLVLAGSDKEGYAATLRAAAAASGVAGQLILPGFVSRELLRALYHGAVCVVLPSLGEGFGLPLVEAMACGAPVLAANRQAIPEVVGDAGGLFEPNDVSGLTDLLNRITEDSSFRDGLIRRGTSRRRRFSWTSAAEATIAVYEDVAARFKSAAAS